ncbi:MAG TPA: Ig-like domain-containing protein [Candidatus Limnocylindrales bacterium]|nr:Ig-like domain-containing protein [Candidatus Limnocylindrales bacterium]
MVLAAALASVLSACSVDAPNIVSIAPGRDARDVPTNQEIRIAFDRPMDHRSVESRFELRPPPDGCAGAAACGLTWQGNTLVYRHAVNLRPDTRYDVVLHGGYRDANGKENSLEHSWAFVTEGLPALSTIDPADGALGVAPDRNIVLTFSRAMDLGSLRTAIGISPQTPFLVRARPGGDGSQVEVIPTELLHPDTAYTVTVEGALDAHGNTLPGRVARSFTAGNPSFARRIAFLIGEQGAGAFAIGIVDPHPDPFLTRSTPKILYQLPDSQRGTSAILAFDWAPDGSRIVMAIGARGSLEGALRIVTLKTSAVQDLPVIGASVSWSPDGSMIAYLSHESLHVFRPFTGQDETLTRDQVVLPSPAFAPDGKSIAYAALDAQGNPRLLIMNLELRSSYRPIGLQDPADHPVWSFDGTRLAFRRLTSRGAQVWVYDVSGGGTTYRQEASLDLQGAAWLNDNSTLLVATGSGAESTLYRINVFAPTEAGGIVKLTGASGPPDGMGPSTPTYDRRIAFTAIIDGLPQLFVMNGDGSAPDQLTWDTPDFPYSAEAANWSPLG